MMIRGLSLSRFFYERDSSFVLNPRFLKCSGVGGTVETTEIIRIFSHPVDRMYRVCA